MKDEIFEEYSREKEPTKYYKTYAWKTAIGLQKVDGLEPSEYLIKTAEQHIDGDISFDDAHKLITSYYKENKAKSERAEEADKVSVRIAEIISEKSFVFSPVEFTTIHKRLFEGIYSHAGRIRDYNITKDEWVLDGDTVIYGNAINLRETLEYDFGVEKNFDYKGLSTEDIIKHVARFISNLWQIHIFGEGNTRTTAVFLIKYLSITETAEKAARQYESTLAVMRLSELLAKSKKVAEVPIKKGTKNQKPFLKMYIMQLDNIKMTVGLQKSTGDKVQYCITSI